jgi:hypothetical protein
LEARAAQARVRTEERFAIDALPEPANTARRENCRASLLLFIENYLKPQFNREHGKPHLETIAYLEDVITQGGKIVIALPRGYGKTTLCNAAILWALLYGYKKNIVFICAGTSNAERLLDGFKTIIEVIEPLKEDFPEFILPIRMLAGSSRRGKMQTYNGKPTKVHWGKNTLRFASLDGYDATGGCLTALGIKSSFRGMSVIDDNGITLRPDMILIDDPQTDAVAMNADRVRQVEHVINGAVNGLQGSESPLSVFMTVTVIRNGDVADRYLNPELYPSWERVRYSLLDSMPENMDLWKEYWNIYCASRKRGTEFYIEHKEPLNKGASVSWQDYYVRGRDVDALQRAMNLYFESPATFASEYQNKPISLYDMGYSVEDIAAKATGLPADTAMDDAAAVTAFVDVHGDILYWLCTAFSRGGHGHIVNYGTFPQHPRNASRKDINASGKIIEGETGLHNGLKNLLNQLLAYQCRTTDNRLLGIDKIFVDTGWRPDIIETVINEINDKHIQPTRGFGIKATTLPMGDWRSVKDRHIGNGWYEDKPKNRSLRTLTIDTNAWKDKIAELITANRYAMETLTLFGAAEDHRVLAEHWTAERPTAVEANGNRVNEWAVTVNRDNHYFDCIVGCAAGANTIGIGRQAAAKESPRPITIR